MKRSQKRRVEKLENQNPETNEVPAIERVIVDTPEQAQHPERFNKVLIHKTDNRKIYELERK